LKYLGGVNGNNREAFIFAGGKRLRLFVQQIDAIRGGCPGLYGRALGGEGGTPKNKEQKQVFVGVHGMCVITNINVQMTIRFKETKIIPEAARFRQAYNSRSAAVVRFSQPRLVWQQMFRRAADVHWIALVS
jgi:hypothetical protein